MNAHQIISQASAKLRDKRPVCSWCNGTKVDRHLGPDGEAKLCTQCTDDYGYDVENGNGEMEED